MYRGAHVAVVVPAFNEARLVRAALRDVPAWVDRIVLVDDASTDATAERAASLSDERIVVLQHRRNRGVGAAIATGYRFAFGRGADVVAVMAGDAQMDARDLPALLDPVVEGYLDYAKGNRLRWPGVRAVMPFTRWLGNHILSALTRLATGLSVGDAQCGYTAISRRAAAILERESFWHGYGYPNDVLARLSQAKLAIGDVCVRPVYRDEDSGIRVHHAVMTIPWLLMKALARRQFGAGARPSTAQSVALVSLGGDSAMMTPATMTPATMTPATMTPATMTPATMTSATMTPATMTPATMTSATMTSATMTSATMTSANTARRAQAHAQTPRWRHPDGFTRAESHRPRSRHLLTYSTSDGE